MLSQGDGAHSEETQAIPACEIQMLGAYSENSSPQLRGAEAEDRATAMGKPDFPES